MNRGITFNGTKNVEIPIVKTENIINVIENKINSETGGHYCYGLNYSCSGKNQNNTYTYKKYKLELILSRICNTKFIKRNKKDNRINQYSYNKYE
jgi:hypothetical protein